MRTAVPSLVLLLALTGSAAPAPVARVQPNDNRVAAGVLRGGVLTLRLEARPAEWHPDGERAPGAVVPAFAEVGRPAQIPGPLVRVPAGTAVEVTLRNALDTTLVVHGLYDRGDPSAAAPADQARSVSLAPGATRTLRLRLNVPGTYYYWGTTTGRAINWRTREDAQLTGALVVDPAGVPAPRDRIFVIGMWTDTVARVNTERQRILAVVNGRAWPHTERLAETVGDTVRWHVVNASGDLHPMHLHGFYFRVDGRGDGVRDTLYADGIARMANTEAMFPGSTMRLTWVPERAGNWLFHCHIPEHFAPRGPLGTALPRAHTGGDHALHAMGGLVLGVTVREARGTALRVANRGKVDDKADDVARRHLRLLVRENGGSSPAAPFYSFALQSGDVVPPVDSGPRIGPTMELVRGEPVRITVVNTLSQPTAVHWHGIELESYFDGVAGYSGVGTRLSPLIAPRDSFEVRMTPPRAGTFIYHTHVDEENQQVAGLAGPLLVLEPGVRRDPAKDITVLVTSDRGPTAHNRAMLVNGSLNPAPLELRVGERYRLRFINMTVRRSGLLAELRRDTTLLRWRRVAKDGADVPEAWRAPVAARHGLTIGETFDVEITPDAPGALRLDFVGPPGLRFFRFASLPIVVR